jgi:hypothetical protein
MGYHNCLSVLSTRTRARRWGASVQQWKAASFPAFLLHGSEIEFLRGVCKVDARSCRRKGGLLALALLIQIGLLPAADDLVPRRDTIPISFLVTLLPAAEDLVPTTAQNPPCRICKKFFNPSLPLRQGIFFPSRRPAERPSLFSNTATTRLSPSLQPYSTTEHRICAAAPSLLSVKLTVSATSLSSCASSLRTVWVAAKADLRH